MLRDHEAASEGSSWQRCRAVTKRTEVLKPFLTPDKLRELATWRRRNCSHGTPGNALAQKGKMTGVASPQNHHIGLAGQDFVLRQGEGNTNTVYNTKTFTAVYVKETLRRASLQTKVGKKQ
jgi:hypothetical protein